MNSARQKSWFEALEIGNLRSHAVIATKVGLEWRDGKVYRNATRERIMQEIDQSLRRLRTDYIDIYQVHWPDPLVPIEETAQAMLELYEEGTIRAIGVSNFSVAQMERFRRIAPLTCCRRPTNCSSGRSRPTFSRTAARTTSQPSATERCAAVS